MKIGIISMQRVINYGSFLQAYGLKSLLEEMGHEVTFIDYKEGKPVVPYSKKEEVKFNLLRLAPVLYANDFIKYYILKRREFPFEYRLFYLKDLGVGYKRMNSKVDVAVIGSDEVFNCLQDGPNVGFSPMLFGQGINANKVISYAASFGYTDIDGLEKYGVKERVSKYLKTFAAISVRDNNSMEIVKELTGQCPELNLDPVLMYDYEIPKKKIKLKDYVILYTYRSRKYSEEEKQIIQEFCRKNNKKLASIGNSQDWVKHHIHANPFEMLAYIKAADYIITDTFHGTVFSIKYNKQFAVLIRPDNKQKLSDLVNRLGQSDRIITSFDQIQEMYEKKSDFTETNEIIRKEKEHAREYLKTNLG